MQENQLRFAANGYWAEVAREARSVVAGECTVVLMGDISASGTLVVETARPHELWLGDERRENLSQSRIQLDPSVLSQRLVVRTSLLAADWPLASPSIRVRLDGKELAGGVTPLADIYRTGSEGFTWAFYTNLATPLSPEQAVDSLRGLGFGRIIVPFYGNPHFVREVLRLRPFYQDRWLQAYSLPPP